MTRKLRVAIAIAVLAALVLAGIWILGTTPPGVPAQSRDDAFVLPATLRADPEKLVAELTKVDLWGLGAAAYARPSPAGAGAVAAKEPGPWALTGSYAIGAQSYVLISFQGKTSEPLKVGDALPGGARILAIGQDQICILINGKKRALDIRTR